MNLAFASEWNRFRSKVIAAEASAAQIADMRDAFYAGALVIFQAVDDATASSPAEEERAVAELAAIRDEVIEYLTRRHRIVREAR